MKRKLSWSFCIMASYIIMQLFVFNAAAQPPTNNLVLWLKADAGTNTIPPPQTNFDVYGWADQSPAGAHSGVPQGSSAPVLETVTFPNGPHPMIHFNGNAGFALNSSAGLQLSNLSIYVVGSVDNTLAAKAIVTCYEDGQDGFPIGGWVLGINDSTPGQAKWFSVSPSPDTLSPAAAALGNDTPTLMTATYDGDSGTKTLYINSSEAGSETGLGPIYYSGNEAATIGYLVPNGAPRQQMVGNVAEVLVFNSVDATQRTNVEAYLNAKYFTSDPVVAPPTNGLVLWLKADTGVDTNGPVPVYGWNDQTPGSKRFGTPNGDPLLEQATFPNGQHPVVHFDGSSGFALDNAADLQANDISIFVVASVDNGATGRGILTCYNDSTENADSGGWALGINDSSAGVPKWFSYNPGGDTLSPASALGNYQPALISATFDSSTGTKSLYVDSTQVATETGILPIYYSGREVLALGYLTPSRQQLLGNVAEVIAYNTADETTRTNVEAYLQAKYFTSDPVVAPPTNGMLLWFKADTGVITNPPAPIISWANQASGGVHSGLPNNADNPPTLTEAPFPNGDHPVVRFNGSGGFNLDHPDTGLQDVSVYIVGRFDSAVSASQDWVGNGSDTGGGWGLGINDSTAGWVKWSSSTGPLQTSPLDDSTPAEITATISSSTGQKALYINSVNVASDSGVGTINYDSSQVSLTIGQYNNYPNTHSQFMKGDIAEVLVFSSVDGSQQTAVESYIQQKYFQPNPNLSAMPPTNNLVVWLRADQGVNTNIPPVVYNWYDQAPDSLHSGTAIGKPTMDSMLFPDGQMHPVIHLNGSSGFALNNTNDGLQLPSLSVYAVASMSSDVKNKTIISCYGEVPFPVGGWALGLNDTTPGLTKWFTADPDYTDATLAPSGAAYSNNVPTLIAGTYDNGNKYLYVNSAEVGAQTGLNPLFYSYNETASVGYLVWDSGIYQQFPGDIAELMVYDSVDQTQKAEVEGYLHDKYGLSIMPSLLTQVSGSQLNLSWYGNGFILQTNMDLSNPSGWGDVPDATNGPAMIDINQTGQEFFRLRQLP